MKYIVIFLSLFFLSFSSLFAACQPHQDGNMNMSLSAYLKGCAEDTTGVSPGETGEGVSGFKDFVKKIATRVVTFGALFAVGAIVWAGIQYTKAFGDDEALKTAKNTGVYALIGLIILLVSFPFVDIIVDFIYRGFT